jgi:hypothetical protein
MAAPPLQEDAMDVVVDVVEIVAMAVLTEDSSQRSEQRQVRGKALYS